MVLIYHTDKNKDDNCHASRKKLYNKLIVNDRQCINVNNIIKEI